MSTNAQCASSLTTDPRPPPNPSPAARAWTCHSYKVAHSRSSTYNTFPRSSASSSRSGTTTPIRASEGNTRPASINHDTIEALESVPPPQMDQDSRQTGSNGAGPELESRNSGGGSGARYTDTWKKRQAATNALKIWTKGGKYRDEGERAQAKADPRTWQVLRTAIASASALQQQQHGPSDVDGRLRKRMSRSSLLMSPKWDSNDSGFNHPSILVDEPASYIRLAADGEQDRVRARPPSIGVDKPSSPGLVPLHNGRTLPIESDNDSNDDSSDDDDSESSSSDDETTVPRPRSRPSRLRVPQLSPVWRNVIKCVLAYFLSELWTFVPVLTDWLGAPWDVDGPVKNAHVVATISVYFNPGRTIGSMVEADIWMLIGVAYAMFLSCGSMAMSAVLDRLGHEVSAHILVLLVWLGGGYTMLAYVKVTANKPTVTTVCSMVALVTSVIITKEGAFHVGKFESYAILQVLLITVIGSATSNLVCFFLWPTSATSKLQADLNRTLSSFSTLVDMLTKTFLLEGDFNTRPEALKRAIDAHQASYTTLKASLAHAKFEVLDSRISAVSDVYDEVVETILKLSQGLTGLRGGIALQYELMQADTDSEKLHEDKAEHARLRDELLVLNKFKERVGPSLRSLVAVSRKTLGLLRKSFMRTTQGSANRLRLSQAFDEETAVLVTADDLASLKLDLEQALVLFKREHLQAIRLLYKTLPAQTLYPPIDAHSDPFSDPGLETDGGPNENLFRIFNYCFNLEEWSRQLVVLVEEFQDIRTTEEEVERTIISRGKRWGPLAGLVTAFGGIRWRHKYRRGRGIRLKATLGRRALTLRRQIARSLSLSDDVPNPFPQVVDGALTSHQFGAPEHRSWIARLKSSIWMLGWRLKQPNVRFAIKTGAGAAILASSAFDQYRPVWLEYRGEWALLSYMVVMSSTTGQTNFLAFGRIVGTFAGAAAAVACYKAFPENAVVLPLLGALLSVPCFYVIVTRPQYGPSSRFVLLTFNLTSLYAFNLREVDTDVVYIAWHRSLAVALGVVWGLVVTNFVWPSEARRELRHGLSTWMINAAHLYTEIVKSYSSPPSDLARAMVGQADETTSLLTRHIDEAEDAYVSMEVYLQRSLIKLQGLVSATAHEPRLKGRFPVQSYRAVLTSCQTILDLLTSIQHAITREAWYKSIRRDFIQHCQLERRAMVGNVVLYFSLLASALTLKTPLPAFLPPASEARLALVQKLRTLPVVRKRIVRGGSEGLLYLGYALTMMDVIHQLEFLGATFQQLFGIIGGAQSTREFDSLFEPLEDDSDTDESHRHSRASSRTGETFSQST
ncbi:hypothetical protein ACM66B_005213 [Microbotryomycetes sp. NB124-2]